MSVYPSAGECVFSWCIPYTLPAKCVQWNPSIAATIGECNFVLYRGVALSQGWICTKLGLGNISGWLVRGVPLCSLSLVLAGLACPSKNESLVCLINVYITLCIPTHGLMLAGLACPINVYYITLCIPWV